MATNQRIEGEQLKSLVDDLQERIKNLKLFDKQTEVNSHCDVLIGQVTFIVQSAIQRVQEMETKLIDEINNYRDELLGANRRSFYEKNEKERMEDNVRLLEREVEALGSKCSLFLSEEDSIQKAICLKESCKDMRKQLRKQIFDAGLMKFNENKQLLEQDNVIGSLSRVNPDEADEIEIKHIVLDELDYKSTEVDRDQKGLSEVSLIRFLPDGNIAVKLKDRPIIVWCMKTNKKLFELKGCHMTEFDMFVLPNDHLATFDTFGSITIWSLRKKRIAKSWKDAKYVAQSIDIFPNGQIVCLYAYDIRIWDPLAKGEPLIRRIPIIELDANPKSVAAMLDGIFALVTIELERLKVKMYDSKDGRLVKRIELRDDEIDHYFLLETQVILVLCNGIVKIRDLKNGSVISAFRNDTGLPFVVHKPLNGTYEFLYGSIWAKSRTNSVKHQHLLGSKSSSISSDGKYLATGFFAGMMLLWTLKD